MPLSLADLSSVANLLATIGVLITGRSEPLDAYRSRTARGSGTQ
jgi:hypothetical protein